MDYGFRYCLAYDYDKLAKAPAFEDFLIQVMNGRTDLVQVVLEFFGYCLSSEDCWAQKSLILTGEGSNGKSTLMDVLKAVAGDDNYSTLTFKDINNEASRRMLDGRLFNLSEETPTQAITESSLFKNLTSGGEVTVKMLYKQPYAIKNKAKILFACNELPRTKDTSKGFFRRLLIVPFDKRFEGSAKDPFIKHKLFKELPGILNLILDGHARLKAQQAFTQSKTIDKQIKDYQLELDSVRSWFDRCIQMKALDSGLDIPLSSLYGHYKIYAEDIGEKPEPESVFSRRLRRVMPKYVARKKRAIIKGKKEILFKGVQCSETAGF
jgi:putative DNA primase/helicase